MTLRKSLLVPDFVAFSLNPKSTRCRDKLKGQSPGEPVRSAAMQRLHSSAQETSNGTSGAFLLLQLGPQWGQSPVLPQGWLRALKKLGLTKSPQKHTNTSWLSASCFFSPITTNAFSVGTSWHREMLYPVCSTTILWFHRNFYWTLSSIVSKSITFLYSDQTFTLANGQTHNGSLIWHCYLWIAVFSD